MAIIKHHRRTPSSKNWENGNQNLATNAITWNTFSNRVWAEVPALGFEHSKLGNTAIQAPKARQHKARHENWVTNETASKTYGLVILKHKLATYLAEQESESPTKFSSVLCKSCVSFIWWRQEKTIKEWECCWICVRPFDAVWGWRIDGPSPITVLLSLYQISVSRCIVQIIMTSCTATYLPRVSWSSIKPGHIKKLGKIRSSRSVMTVTHFGARFMALKISTLFAGTSLHWLYRSTKLSAC